MVLFNRYNFMQIRRQKKKKSLDNPTVNDPNELTFRQPDLSYLLNLKQQMDAREARVVNLALKRRLLEGQEKANYEMELNRLRSETRNPGLPETTVEHMENRIKKLEQLSETIF